MQVKYTKCKLHLPDEFERFQYGYKHFPPSFPQKSSYKQVLYEKLG